MRHFLLPQLFFLTLWFYAQTIQAQCSDTEIPVLIEVNPDTWTHLETSWRISNMGVTIDSSVAISTTVCVPADACLAFDIYDEYGDGIVNGGYCRVTFNNEIIFEASNQMGKHSTTDFGTCPQGYSCHFAIPITPNNNYLALQDNSWYTITPDSTGQYLIAACNNTCPTQIWLYNYCQDLNVTEGPEGALAFSTAGCQEQAQLGLQLQKDQTYYIRIGDENDQCTDPINWELTFIGQITGCTDPTACNYNPAATILDSTSCIYPGDPACGAGPDLVVLQEVLVSSMHLSIIPNNDDCYLQEGCFTGYGNREIINFTTHIKNIGTQDYVIGTPPASINQPTDQFEYDPCHQHWHYEGYAEYLMLNEQGQSIAVGYKNGFCVMDLECTTGTYQYGCGYMGISAGCGDIYDAGLDCQWIDITTLPEGQYTLVVRVNWDNTPDFLGHQEANTSNNWAQVCVNISRNDVTNVASINVIPDCAPYVDCSGTTFGSAQIDCTGQCGGTSKHGDMDGNGILHTDDVFQYANAILENETVTNCNDLNADNRLNVADAAELIACIMQNAGSHTHSGGGSAHNHCKFPVIAIHNPNDTIQFSIGEINIDQHYIDLQIENPTHYILDYQFQIRGLSINGVESTLQQPDYYANYFFHSNGNVMCLAPTEKRINRYIEPTSFLRIYYSEITEPEICINFISVLNDSYETVNTNISPNCIPNYMFTAVNNAPDNNTQHYIAPNPMTNTATLWFNNPTQLQHDVIINDMNGKIVRQYKHISSNQLEIERQNLAAGVYTYHIISKNNNVSGKIVIW